MGTIACLPVSAVMRISSVMLPQGAFAKMALVVSHFNFNLSE